MPITSAVPNSSNSNTRATAAQPAAPVAPTARSRAEPRVTTWTMNALGSSATSSMAQLARKQHWHACQLVESLLRADSLMTTERDDDERRGRMDGEIARATNGRTSTTAAIEDQQQDVRARSRRVPTSLDDSAARERFASEARWSASGSWWERTPLPAVARPQARELRNWLQRNSPLPDEGDSIDAGTLARTGDFVHYCDVSTPAFGVFKQRYEARAQEPWQQQQEQRERMPITPPPLWEQVAGTAEHTAHVSRRLLRSSQASSAPSDVVALPTRSRGPSRSPSPPQPGSNKRLAPAVPLSPPSPSEPPVKRERLSERTPPSSSSPETPRPLRSTARADTHNSPDFDAEPPEPILRPVPASPDVTLIIKREPQEADILADDDDERESTRHDSALPEPLRPAAAQATVKAQAKAPTTSSQAGAPLVMPRLVVASPNGTRHTPTAAPSETVPSQASDPGAGALARLIPPSKRIIPRGLATAPQSRRVRANVRVVLNEQYKAYVADHSVDATQRPRRGAWVIPVHGRLYLSDRAAQPRWATSMSQASNDERGMIAWNEARLKVFWNQVARLQRGGKLGIDAQCHIAAAEPESHDHRAILPLPDLITVGCEARYALELRTLLSIISVKPQQDGGDTLKFLRLDRDAKILLAFVDDQGHPLFLA